MHKSYSKELKERKLRLKYGVDMVPRTEYASSSESGESSPSHSPPYITSSAPSSPTYTYRTPHYGTHPEHHGSRSRLYSAGTNKEQSAPRNPPPSMGAKSSSSGSLLKDLERLRQAQRERGEKLGRTVDQTEVMADRASVFSRTTKALEKKHRDKAKSWWPF
ncbi:uncharacterized protein LOC100378524 [Saccoglossus kowalevskii]|uniref:Uncharacterized protein LOC100378524 n=1 Tax=Saccoglossus kowalevskii TaxID=10224 RepID=A0ABM0GRU1_SACKO|nr:PREDICTED: uncharacterized protein LOC100378524 [Saccoglossus kowalevskii]